MKLLLGVLTLIAFGPAHASYMATYYSNSNTSVKWQTGHDSITITTRHYGAEEEEITIPF